MADSNEQDARVVSPVRDRIALVLFALLAIAILSVLPRATWHSALSCDSRTHVEMIRGVAEHGLPYTENGEIGRFPELQARWNLVHDGRLWGTYPPLFAYVGAPFLRIGGLPAVSRMNVGFLLVFALGTFVVASRFLKDRLWGSAAACLAVLSTPIPATAIDMSPYVLSDALFIWGTFFTMVSLTATPFRARASAAFAGILGALAISAHLLAFPMVMGLVVAAAIGRAEEGPRLLAVPSVVPFAAWTPTRTSLLRSAAAFGGLVLGLLPVSFLNHLRFGSFNPISYGPCPWKSCAESGQDQQHILDMLIYAGPALLLFSVVPFTAWVLRKNLRVSAAVLLAGVVFFIACAPVRIHAWHIARIAWGNVVDVTWLDLSFPFYSPPDGVGQLLGPWVVCSLLQCTPLLVLAPFGFRRAGKARPLAYPLLLPGLFGIGALLLRANQPIAFAFGFPLIFLRYTTPTAAPLIILAISAIRSLKWRVGHGIAIAVAAGVVVTWLLRADDLTLTRRLLVLYGPVVAAALAAFSFWRFTKSTDGRWQTAATSAAAACIAMGLGTNVGRTFPAMERVRIGEDVRTDAISTVVPPHSAVLGFAVEIDTPMATLGQHDVQYGDLYEAKTWSNILPLIDLWTSEGRPVFAFLYPGSTFQNEWPDVAFEPVLPSQNIFRIRRR